MSRPSFSVFRFLHVYAFFLIFSITQASPSDKPILSSLGVEHKAQPIHRDVVIIGGGSSGTYTAIQLLTANMSVAVIEAQPRLGGHTETYRDPVSGAYTDYGVVILYNDTVTREYYAQLGVPLGPAQFAPQNRTVYYDFERREVLDGFVPVDPSAALVRYRAAILKYPFLLNGYGELPDPVPQELLGTVGEFLNANDAEGAADLLGRYNQGIGRVSEQTMLYMAKSMNTMVIDSIIGGGYVANANGNNHEIYEKAMEELGEDALISSRVIGLDRSKDNVRVLVSTPSGTKLIEAKRLVVAIPPKLGNLAGFDLSEEEKALFSKFRNTGYYTGILKNSGIPAGLGINNYGRNTRYNLPVIPGPYGYSPAKVEGLFDVKYGSIDDLSQEEVEERIFQNLKDLQDDGVIPASTTSKPEFVRYSSHNPFTLTVSADDIRRGFYKRLYALQGQRNTYYTGAAWEAQDSSLLWRFTKNNVIPLILECD